MAASAVTNTPDADADVPSSRPCPRAGVPVAVAVALTVFLVVSGMRARTRQSRAERESDALVTLDHSVNEVSALLSDARADAYLRSEAAQTLRRDLAAVDVAIGRLHDDDADDPRTGRVARLAASWLRTCRQETTLLARGEFAAAQRLDRRAVDTSYYRLTDVIREDIAEARDRNRSISSFVDRSADGAVAATAFAAVLLGLWWWRARRARVRADRSLLSERLQRAAIVDASEDAIVSTGLDGRILSWNRGAAAMFGFPSATVVGRPLAAVVSGPEIDELVAAAMAGVAVGRHHTTGTRADGTTVALSVAVSLMHDADGRPAGVAVVAHDSTAETQALEALQISEARFRAVVQHSSELVLFLDRDGIIRYASPAARRITGRGPEELIGLHAESYAHPDDVATLRATREIVDGNHDEGQHTTVQFRTRLGADDGAWRWVQVTMTDLFDDPAVGMRVANVRDITADRERQEALRVSEERYRTIVETAQEGIWAMGLDGETLFANQKMAELLGYAGPHDMCGRSVFDHLAPDDVAATRRHLSDRSHGLSASYDRRLIRADGRSIWTRISAAPLRGADGRVTASIVLVSDVSASRAAEERLRHNAFHDALTGLPNRLALTAALDELLNTPDPRPAALFLIDLDHFKEINDTLGHDVGDEVLIEMGLRIRRAVRATDMVARLGGDEFAVLLPGVATVDDATAVAAALTRAVSDNVLAGGTTLAVGLSLGICHAPTNATTAKELLQRADVAMYRAKRSDRLWAVYDPDEDKNRPSRLAIMADLAPAIASRRLEVHFQPQLDLATGMVCGVEALARWPHPSRGDISPGVFVPMAEQGGLARQLATWAIEESLQEIGRWRRDGLAVPVSVNLSPSVLRWTALPDLVADLLDLAGVPADFLTLEITESGLVDPSPAVLATVWALKDLGVRVSVDDFGTGYSSLAYLRRLPMDELKIDRCFVQGITDSPADAAIVQAIVDLSHSLAIHVVAEGIESEGARRLLADMGCDIGQGYGLCRPGPAADIAMWLRSRTRPSAVA